MGWGEIELVVYGARSTTAEGLFCLPEDGTLHSLRLVRGGSAFVLRADLFTGKVDWNVRVFDTGSRRDA